MMGISMIFVLNYLIGERFNFANISVNVSDLLFIFENVYQNMSTLNLEGIINVWVYSSRFNSVERIINICLFLVLENITHKDKD